MSGWLCTEAQPGDEVKVQGPAGECFYVPGRPDQSLLLAGMGTGLAPLYGIARDVLAAGHTRPIWLFHGARDPRGRYLVDELRALAERHPNLHYRPSVLEGRLGEGLHVGALDALNRAECPKPAGWAGIPLRGPGAGSIPEEDPRGCVPAKRQPTGGSGSDASCI